MVGQTERGRALRFAAHGALFVKVAGNELGAQGRRIDESPERVPRQGVESYMVGCIGADENGKLLLERLRHAGVHTEFVVTDPDAATGLCTMNIGSQGRYYSIYAPGANMKLEETAVFAALEQVKFDMVAMQLMHMGYQAYVVGETVTPAIEQEDLLIIASGSGTTGTMQAIAGRCKKIGARLALIIDLISDGSLEENNRILMKRHANLE